MKATLFLLALALLAPPAFAENKPASTTKAYKIVNDGTTEKSSVTQYDSKPSFAAYQDNDLDGTFGEREAKGVDSDLDGRKGEKELQLGTENVTMNQKVTVLNNMGSARSLSDFKAAGQTQRTSVFPDEKKKSNAKDLSSPSIDSSENESTDSSDEEDAPESKPATKARRVLVS